MMEFSSFEELMNLRLPFMMFYHSRTTKTEKIIDRHIVYFYHALKLVNWLRFFSASSDVYFKDGKNSFETGMVETMNKILKKITLSRRLRRVPRGYCRIGYGYECTLFVLVHFFSSWPLSYSLLVKGIATTINFCLQMARGFLSAHKIHNGNPSPMQDLNKHYKYNPQLTWWNQQWRNHENHNMKCIVCYVSYIFFVFITRTPRNMTTCMHGLVSAH